MIRCRPCAPPSPCRIAWRSFNARSHEPIVLKLGLHEGPCIAVTLNDRLDYFGQTVNLAARLQGESAGGDIVLSRPLAGLDGAGRVMARIARASERPRCCAGLPSRSVSSASAGSVRPERGAAMRVAMFSTKPYDRRSFEARNGRVRARAPLSRASPGAETAPLADGFPAVCLFVNDVCDAADAGERWPRWHQARRPALRRLQPCRPRRRRATGHAGGARARLLAACRGRVHGRPDPDAEPPDPPRLQPHPRQQFRARRPDGLRSPRQDRGRGRHRQDRRPGRALVQARLRLRGARARPRRDPELEPSACPMSSLDELAARSDVITLHCPLTPDTRHIVNARAASPG